MFQFEKTILIERPPHEVFKYVINPANVPKWRTDVIETRFNTLPVHVGDRFEEVVNFVGEQVCLIEIVDVVPDRRIVYKALSGATYLPLRELFFNGEDG